MVVLHLNNLLVIIWSGNAFYNRVFLHHGGAGVPGVAAAILENRKGAANLSILYNHTVGGDDYILMVEGNHTPDPAASLFP